jgi:hypothetical protein
MQANGSNNNKLLLIIEFERRAFMFSTGVGSGIQVANRTRERHFNGRYIRKAERLSIKRTSGTRYNKNRRYYKANAGFHYLNVISTKLLIYLESNLLFYIYLVFDFVKLGHCKMKILVS